MSIATPTTPANLSLAELMSLLSDEERAELWASLSEREAHELLFDWHVWARPQQLPPPGNWRVWLVMAGRGFGKTRTGAEWIRQQVKHCPWTNIIGPTIDDARDIMIEGESGILAICPDDERPRYVASKRRLEWPNGAKSLIFTADEPERLRGKQHGKLWADEIAAWRYRESWDQAMFGLRLGDNPQAVGTTTPRPVGLIRDLIKQAETSEVVITRGSSYANRDNLAPAFFGEIVRKYQGTRLGRQELDGELLNDVEGALWNLGLIDKTRLAKLPEYVELARVVIGVDPPATSTSGSAECGIVAAGLGTDGRGYVLEDLSIRGTPNEWAHRVVYGYDKWRADHVTPETNNGGEMVISTIRTVRDGIPINPVWASRGKQTRAEPVSALYEQERVSHLDTFKELEDQMSTWVPGMPSPDRMDALVWALTDLMIDETGGFQAVPDQLAASLESLGL